MRKPQRSVVRATAPSPPPRVAFVTSSLYLWTVLEREVGDGVRQVDLGSHRSSFNVAELGPR
ncbi:MAG TPA: hypothetical protein VK116_01815, partial [Planctomycetota bacterium]|nr:hypothetical protein [Planctomycetota bacterium]